MADTLKNAFDEINDVELVPGNRGEFTVWLGQTMLAQKTYDGFPHEPDVVNKMREALGK